MSTHPISQPFGLPEVLVPGQVLEMKTFRNTNTFTDTDVGEWTQEIKPVFTLTSSDEHVEITGQFNFGPTIGVDYRNLGIRRTTNDDLGSVVEVFTSHGAIYTASGIQAVNMRFLDSPGPGKHQYQFQMGGESNVPFSPRNVFICFRRKYIPQELFSVDSVGAWSTAP